VLVLSDHINSYVRAAIESGDAQEKVAELVTGSAVTSAADDP
jgi:hypothetical protein